MKARTFVASLTGLLLIAVCAGAVEPSYEGRLGNPEEPALRPYKWLWHGLESLVYYAGESIQHGNMKTPVLGMSEIGRGLRKGNIELGESLQHGVLFAPLPPKNNLRQFGRVNETLEEREKCKETADFLFGGPLYPIMKLTVDMYPAIKDNKQTQASTPGGIELTGFPQPPHGVLDSPLSNYPAHKMCGCPQCAQEKHNAEPVAKE
ncbi:MAG TPA: hypothetical protein PLI09_27150 [Candidatus Hydrogenedentes bacterium]|nr:hypothetical protein [Candidatus Hydrogenedentota bacterium]